MLNCIEEFHQAGFVHRDIRFANFLFWPNMNNSLCLIDFGISYPYIDKETRKHISCSRGTKFFGSPSCAAPNAHRGITLSRRDDLISWIYSTVEMIDGRLPGRAESDVNKVGRMKKEISGKSLCSSLPSVFSKFYKYILNLNFEEVPNYQYIRRYAQKVLLSTRKSQFDWEKIPPSVWKEIIYIPIEYNDNDSLSAREDLKCCIVS
jgi:serine/threonine protein kinase